MTSWFRPSVPTDQSKRFDSLKSWFEQAGTGRALGTASPQPEAVVLARPHVFVAMAGLYVVIAPARNSRPALPCPNPMSVAVTPDGGSQQWIANTNGHTATYTVYNTGACNDTYSFSYTVSGPISGVSLNKTSAPVAVGGNTTVIATYNV